LQSPNPEQIKAARSEGQREAAERVYVTTYRTWQNWELGVNAMPAAVWELYLLKTDQHPTLRLVKKRTRREEHGNEEQQRNEAGEV
jgi:hypothetical protein